MGDKGSCLGSGERSLTRLLLVYNVIVRSLCRRLTLAEVLGHLARGLRGLWSHSCLRQPTAAAVVFCRRPWGTPVMRHLFPRACHPMATEQTERAFRVAVRIMAIDGTLALGG
jgi:hypothetical protein